MEPRTRDVIPHSSLEKHDTQPKQSDKDLASGHDDVLQRILRREKEMEAAIAEAEYSRDDDRSDHQAQCSSKSRTTADEEDMSLSNSHQAMMPVHNIEMRSENGGLLLQANWKQDRSAVKKAAQTDWIEGLRTGNLTARKTKPLHERSQASSVLQQQPAVRDTTCEQLSSTVSSPANDYSVNQMAVSLITFLAEADMLMTLFRKRLRSLGLRHAANRLRNALSVPLDRKLFARRVSGSRRSWTVEQSHRP